MRRRFRHIRYMRDADLVDMGFDQGDPIPRIGEYVEASYLCGTVLRITYMYNESVIIIVLGERL